MRSKPKRPQRSIYLLCLFVVGLIISCSAMQVAYNAGNRQLVLIFALASGITCIAACLTFWMIMVGVAARQAQARASTTVHSDHDDENYRARFFLKDRISLLCLTVGSALLTGISFSQPGHYPMKALFVGMLVFSSVTAYRHCLLSVLFTKRTIEAKVGLFTHYSEPYDQVVALMIAPRSLKLRFADGRKLNILPGLGDMARIATLLEERINITPEFIGWNGSKNPPTSTRSQS